MDALGQLDRMRREAVDRARLNAFEARERLRATEDACKTAREALRDAERGHERAQQDFTMAREVLALRAAEAQLAYARSVRERTRGVLASCERARAAARAELQAHEQALVEAELGRRAVERKLTQRAADVGRRTEREREAEAEDAFRAVRPR